MAGPNISAEVRQRLDTLCPGPHAGSCGTAAFTRAAVFVCDTQVDPRWEGLREVARELGIRSCWSIPIVDDDRVFGTFAISHLVQREPSDRDRELLVAGARRAAIAVRRSSGCRRYRA